MEGTWEYSRSDFLNDLVFSIDSERCSLSASLAPNVPEFLEARKKSRDGLITEIFPNALKGKVPEGFDEKRWRDTAWTGAMIELCRRNGIIPFWGLRWDYELRQFNEPSLEYCGPSVDWITQDPKKTLTAPIFLCGDEHTWYNLSFNVAQGKESVDRVKYAIVSLLRKEYVVTSVHAQLNRWIRGGEYFDTEECDAEIHAYNGKISMYGKAIPKDFHPDKVPRWDTRKQEPREKMDGLQALLI